MSISVNGQTPSGHAHRHHRSDSASAATDAKTSAAATATAATGSTNAAATTPASDPTGIQSFASELQSFLLRLQSGQASTGAASTTTQTDASGTAAASTAAPAGSPQDLDAPPGNGVLTNVAEQLQHLLQGMAGASNPASGTASNTVLNSGSAPGTAAAASGLATGADATNPNSLESVLDKMQATLSQALKNYQTADAPGSTTNLTS